MIIAKKEKNKVVVGYSNVDVWGMLCEKDYIDEENVAIRFSKNGMMFACAKMNRSSDILLYDEGFLGKEITSQSIVREIIPYVKKKLVENNQSINEGRWDNSLIICNNDRIYNIDPLFGFFEVNDFVCYGYREESLKCVLDETIGLPAEESIIKAMVFISELHKENMFPIIITDTKSKKFKYFYKG